LYCYQTSLSPFLLALLLVYCAFTHILLVNGGISRLDGVALRLCGTTIPLYDNWEQPRFHNLMRLKPIELAHTKFNVIKGNIFNN